MTLTLTHTQTVLTCNAQTDPEALKGECGDSKWNSKSENPVTDTAGSSGTLNSAHVRNMQPAKAFAGYATSHDTSSISSCTGQNQQLRWKNTAGLELHSEACSPSR